MNEIKCARCGFANPITHTAFTPLGSRPYCESCAKNDAKIPVRSIKIFKN